MHSSDLFQSHSPFPHELASIRNKNIFLCLQHFDRARLSATYLLSTSSSTPNISSRFSFRHLFFIQDSVSILEIYSQFYYNPTLLMHAKNDQMERVRADLLVRANARNDIPVLNQQQYASYSFAMGASVEGSRSPPQPRHVPRQSPKANQVDSNMSYRTPIPPPRYPASQPNFAISTRPAPIPGKLYTASDRSTQSTNNSSIRSNSGQPGAQAQRFRPPFATDKPGLPSSPRRTGRRPHARAPLTQRPVYERDVPVRQVRLVEPTGGRKLNALPRDVELGERQHYENNGEKGNGNRRIFSFIPWPQSPKVRASLLQSIVSFVFFIGLLGVCESYYRADLR